MKYALAFLLLLTLLGAMKSMSTNIVGIVYPLFKSIESLEGENKNDDRLWLTYWVCFSCFVLFDSVAGKLLLNRVVPFYFFIKLGFLIYLFHPYTFGAKTVYANVLLPIFRGHEVEMQQLR